jgi:hypothetical protein
MPQGSLTISKALSNVSLAYKPAEFIFNKILPDVYVEKESGQFWVYNKNWRLEETVKTNRAEAKMATWDASTGTYYVTKHALKDVVTDEDRDNADAPFNLDVDTVEFLTEKILLRQEKEVADMLFTTTSFSNNATGNSTTSWRYNTTTSISPLQTGISVTSVILAQSGKIANTVITSRNVFDALKENQNVYNRLAYTKDQILTEQILASMFDVQNFYVGSAQYETQKEGETSTQTALWSDDVLFAYFDGQPGLKKLTTANMFRTKRYGSPYIVKKWREEGIEGDMIEVQTKCKPKVVASLCAFFYKSIIL